MIKCIKPTLWFCALSLLTAGAGITVGAAELPPPPAAVSPVPPTIDSPPAPQIAASPSPTFPGKMVTGKIVAVDKQKNQVTIDIAGKLHVLKIGADLKIFKDGKPATIEDFVPNQELSLATRETAQGTLVVGVNVGPSPSLAESAGRPATTPGGNVPGAGGNSSGNGPPFATPRPINRPTSPIPPQPPIDRPIISPF